MRLGRYHVKPRRQELEECATRETVEDETRAATADLIGDIEGTAQRRFAGDEVRAARWLKEQQGTLILGALRDAGHDHPAVFVHDFTERRLKNLRKLYGKVGAVASFDAAAIRDALEALR